MTGFMTITNKRDFAEFDIYYFDEWTRLKPPPALNAKCWEFLLYETDLDYVQYVIGWLSQQATDRVAYTLSASNRMDYGNVNNFFSLHIGTDDPDVAMLIKLSLMDRGYWTPLITHIDEHDLDTRIKAPYYDSSKTK